MDSTTRPATSARRLGQVIRAARKAQGLTLAQLGERTGYSAAQVSRYERGITPPGLATLRRLATALEISPHLLGLTAWPARRIAPSGAPGQHAGPGCSTVAREAGPEDGEQVRRRELLADLAAASASAAVGLRSRPSPSASPGPDAVGALLAGNIRDAMFGLIPPPDTTTRSAVQGGLAAALGHFRACRYRSMAGSLPRLISAGHLLVSAGNDEAALAILAGIYTLATRMLIKLDDLQLGWMAADRAKSFAASSGDIVRDAEAARDLAVLARKAGWHPQAMSIALTAAASPRLRGDDGRLACERGLLIQSAAYTSARTGDQQLMRELTAEAAAIAHRYGQAALLRDQDGFTPATVTLHLISAEAWAGDPRAAIAAAAQVVPASLPTTERRARYWTDTARAYHMDRKRAECTDALLAAEYEAPQDIRARPAVRDLVHDILSGGPASPQLKDLARRCGIT